MTPTLSIVMATYGQPLMMAKQVETWDSYSPEVHRALQVIVVDDCGTPPFTCEGEKPYDLQIYRVIKDIPWNQMGARNLGMRKAAAKWRAMLDPDMVISPTIMAKIFARIPSFRAGHLYRVWLMHMPENDKPFDFGSPNSYIVNASDFWNAGGYNEDFAGNKGYSDVVLHRTLCHMCSTHNCKDLWYDFYPQRMFADAAVSTLDRSVKNNHPKFVKAVNFASRNGWGMYAKGVGPHVRFPWEQVR
jgi:glycosyltransferase involved in cell wall biosynthesis